MNINKLKNKMVIEVGRPQKKYRVTIEDLETGEILYRWESFSGMGCSVEQVTKFGLDMEGVHQIFGWGHPMSQFYAFDQIKQWFMQNSDEFIDTLAANGLMKGDIEGLKKMLKK